MTRVISPWHVFPKNAVSCTAFGALKSATDRTNPPEARRHPQVPGAGCENTCRKSERLATAFLRILKNSDVLAAQILDSIPSREFWQKIARSVLKAWQNVTDLASSLTGRAAVLMAGSI
jgi:hypothetical protein